MGLWQYPSVVALAILVAHTVLARVWQSLLNNLYVYQRANTADSQQQKSLYNMLHILDCEYYFQTLFLSAVSSPCKMDLPNISGKPFC